VPAAQAEVVPWVQREPAAQAEHELACVDEYSSGSHWTGQRVPATHFSSYPQAFWTALSAEPVQ
jgi:hypothetical protein